MPAQKHGDRDYEVISTKKNTVIEYRTMKSNNCVTELKKVNLPEGRKWSKHVALSDGNISSFCPEDEFYFEIIVRGEGKGTIFAGLRTSVDIDDPNKIEGKHIDLDINQNKNKIMLDK